MVIDFSFVFVDKFRFYSCNIESNKNLYDWYNKLLYMDKNLYAGK